MRRFCYFIEVNSARSEQELYFDNILTNMVGSAIYRKIL